MLLFGIVFECLISRGMESDDKHISCIGIIQVDIAVKYLNFFLEDDAELEHIKTVRFLFWLIWLIVY